MGFGGGPDDSAAQEEAARQKRITEGTQKVNAAFAGFTPDFYGTQARAYNEFALPQLDDQYTAAAKQLKYALARQYGTTQTSEAASRTADLDKKYALARANITEQGLQKAKEAQSSVEDEKSRILALLNQTADPAAAANMAMQQVDILQKPTAFEPIQNLFGDVTAGLATMYGPQGGMVGGTNYPTYTYDPVTNQYKKSDASRTVNY
jgi:hypothetical protein